MFYEIFNDLCKTKKTTVSAVVKKLNLSTSKVTAWKNGSIPKGDILAQIADLLEVSVDYLLERETNQDLTGVEKKLIEDYRSLSEQGKEYILQTMNIATTSFRHHIKSNHIAIAANEEISKPAVKNKSARKS